MSQLTLISLRRRIVGEIYRCRTATTAPLDAFASKSIRVSLEVWKLYILIMYDKYCFVVMNAASASDVMVKCFELFFDISMTECTN